MNPTRTGTGRAATVHSSSRGTVIHYHLGAGVTVRVGMTNVLLCMTCLVTDCAHVAKVAPLHAQLERDRANEEVPHAA